MTSLDAYLVRERGTFALRPNECLHPDITVRIEPPSDDKETPSRLFWECDRCGMGFVPTGTVRIALHDGRRLPPSPPPPGPRRPPRPPVHRPVRHSTGRARPKR